MRLPLMNEVSFAPRARTPQETGLAGVVGHGDGVT